MARNQNIPLRSVAPLTYSDNEDDYPYGDDEEQNLLRRPARSQPPISSYPHDPRFDVPTPSPWARGALLLALAGMFWLAFNMRAGVLDGLGMLPDGT